MSENSSIEWTDATWNPVTGCTKVSPGCAHCYAETFAERFRGVHGHPYENGFDLQRRPERMDLPLTWAKPKRIFVNSMSDLFHADVPESYIRGVFDTMRRAHWHTFQVLTKRPKRAAKMAGGLAWPANVWMGTSVENRRWTVRIDSLRAVPAAVRFISFEPLLGPLGELNLAGIDLAIFGGESGAKARACDLAWIRDGKAQCEAQGTKVFVKQLGAKPFELRDAGMLQEWRTSLRLKSRKGGDMEEWPEDLRVREMPGC